MIKYTIIPLEDYDEAFKIDNKKVLCFSKKEFKKLEDEPEIIGEVNNYDDIDDDNDDEDKAAIVIAKKLYEVCKPGKTSRLFYSCRGYVEVEENKYIAFYKSRFLFLLWLFIITAIAGLLFAAIVHIGTKPQDKPDDQLHPLPPIDTNVESVSDDSTVSTTDVGENGGSVSMTVKPTATLTLSTGAIDMYFMNPHNSTHDVLIELYIVSTENGEEKEYKIAESGRIPIGSQLSTLTLSADPIIFSSEGVYMARYYVKCYDPDTGEKVIVDPSFNEIKLVVQN